MMLHTPTWDPKILEEVGINEDEISSLGDSLEEYWPSTSRVTPVKISENTGKPL